MQASFTGFFFATNGTNNPFTAEYITVGPAKLRILLTKYIVCDNVFNLIGEVCFADQYNSNTYLDIQTSTLIFNTASENNINTKVINI